MSEDGNRAGPRPAGEVSLELGTLLTPRDALAEPEEWRALKSELFAALHRACRARAFVLEPAVSQLERWLWRVRTDQAELEAWRFALLLLLCADAAASMHRTAEPGRTLELASELPRRLAGLRRRASWFEGFERWFDGRHSLAYLGIRALVVQRRRVLGPCPSRHRGFVPVASLLGDGADGEAPARIDTLELCVLPGGLGHVGLHPRDWCVARAADDFERSMRESFRHAGGREDEDGLFRVATTWGRDRPTRDEDRTLYGRSAGGAATYGWARLLAGLWVDSVLVLAQPAEQGSDVTFGGVNGPRTKLEALRAHNERCSEPGDRIETVVLGERPGDPRLISLLAELEATGVAVAFGPDFAL